MSLAVPSTQWAQWNDLPMKKKLHNTFIWVSAKNASSGDTNSSGAGDVSFPLKPAMQSPFETSQSIRRGIWNQPWAHPLRAGRGQKQKSPCYPGTLGCPKPQKCPYTAFRPKPSSLGSITQLLFNSIFFFLWHGRRNLILQLLHLIPCNGSTSLSATCKKRKGKVWYNCTKVENMSNYSY